MPPFQGKIAPKPGVDRKGGTVTRRRTALGLFFFLFLLTQGSALGLTDVEWNDAVQAAESVDAAVAEPPLTGTDVSVVGGGSSVTGTNFAFSAFSRDGVVEGQMSVTDRLGNHLSADVVCVTAIVSPGGRGGLARLVGELREPQFGVLPTMFFDVFDSNAAGGAGDLWNVSSSPVPPEEFECSPSTPVDPVDNGNIAVRSLN